MLWLFYTSPTMAASTTTILDTEVGYAETDDGECSTDTYATASASTT